MLHDRLEALKARRKQAASEESAEISAQIELTTNEGQELEASARYQRMKDFSETNEQRRAETQNKIPVIQGNLDRVKSYLAAARAALGDHEEILLPVAERPLA